MCEGRCSDWVRFYGLGMVLESHFLEFPRSGRVHLHIESVSMTWHEVSPHCYSSVLRRRPIEKVRHLPPGVKEERPAIDEKNPFLEASCESLSFRPIANKAQTCTNDVFNLTNA